MNNLEKDTVILCGVDGYIGNALTLRLLKQGYKVIGIDNLSRRNKVSLLNSFSATSILGMNEKIRMLKSYGEFEFYYLDISYEYGYFVDIINDYKPSVIVNLAQQPSAPFSHKSRKDAIDTTNNNINGTLNCLYAINETNPEIQLIQIGSMGEYDQSMGVDIEEGMFDFKHNGKIAKNTIFPRRAPSFYHASKIASTYIIDLAVRSWRLNVTDIMQGVVYGNWTSEIEETGIQTRLDTDDCFGTVLNRFIIQALLGHPLTVFGEGEQTRGFLSLNDSIQCLMLAIENPTIGYRTWNQLDEPYKIIDLAKKVKNIVEKNTDHIVNIKYINTPRTENTKSCYYKTSTNKLKELGFKPTRTIEDEITYIFDLLEYEDLSKLLEVVIPKIKW